MQGQITPYITDDTIAIGVLMLCLGFVFYTANLKSKFWKKFYTFIPSVLMCYLLPSICVSLNIISEDTSNLYHVAKYYLLPAALILMTLSIDLKAMFSLGSKALIMFFVGTFGIIIGGPLAIMIVAQFSPETVAGEGNLAIWRGLSTLAGSWIGGGANQTAMLEIFKYNKESYGGMVLVDIVIANIWMSAVLFGVGHRKAIDKWLKADNSAIDKLVDKVSTFTAKITRTPSVADIVIIFAIAFVGVSISHFLANTISGAFPSSAENNAGALSSLKTPFFWTISIATTIGIILSFTKFKNYEGAGASKIGSLFIYFLVATIGMKMNIFKMFDNPGLLAIGAIWMIIHVLIMVVVAKTIKAPYFFLAVGSQANVGGVASAPVVAAEFHPSLTTVGVLLAVFGYAIGTYGAMLCAYLMQLVS
ncbi:MAG: DUF819 domain-containing protein [Bacteroidales bacterium]